MPWLTEVHNQRKVIEKSEEQQAGEALGESKHPPGETKKLIPMSCVLHLPVHTQYDVRSKGFATCFIIVQKY